MQTAKGKSAANYLFLLGEEAKQDWRRVNELLRRLGWRIHQRKGNTEPLWIRDGEVVRESEILARAKKIPEGESS